MNYELIAVITVAVCLLILGTEYIWMYALAVKNERQTKNHKRAGEYVSKMIDGILHSPTVSAQEKETAALVKYAGNDISVLLMICDAICSLSENDNLKDSPAMQSLLERFQPKKLLYRVLTQGDTYSQGFACRKLADFGAKEYVPEIKKLFKSHNRQLKYNAAMALSQLGDGESTADYILSIQEDKGYSYRVVMELFRVFSGDRADVAANVFARCDEYMRVTVIKALAPYKIEEFESMYIEGTGSDRQSMKTACVKALGALGKPENEHTLLICANDENWVVRSAAIKGLQRLSSHEAIKAVKKATGDKEWWVRQTAAQALIEMKVPIADLEDIMKGYDKYAADAVMYSIYRAVDMKDD